MAHTIADYYTDELADWKGAIDFHEEEIEEFEERLTELIRRDTLPRLAASAEHFFNGFLLLQENFNALRHAIDKQEIKLYANDMPLDNSAVTLDIKNKQSELRTKMQQSEKEYIDLKYDCQEFFSNSLIA